MSLKRLETQFMRPLSDFISCFKCEM